jgi:hypothetical protein
MLFVLGVTRNSGDTVCGGSKSRVARVVVRSVQGLVFTYAGGRNHGFLGCWVIVRVVKSRRGSSVWKSLVESMRREER